MAPFVAELAASAAMGFAMNGVTAAVAVLEPRARALARERLAPEHAELVDGALLFKLLMFVLLCSFFSETFARVSRSSVMNPAVLFLQRTVGGISTLQFLAGIVASTAGTCLGIFALKLTLAHVADNYPGYALVHPSRSMSILEHKVRRSGAPPPPPPPPPTHPHPTSPPPPTAPGVSSAGLSQALQG